MSTSSSGQLISAGHAQRVSPHFHLKDLSAAVVFLLPTFIILGTFKVFPAFYSLFLSFFEWDGLSQGITAVGGANYSDLFSSKEFWNSLRVTLVYAGGVTLFALFAGLILAVMLNTSLRGQTGFRVIYFLPVITPTVASGVIWKYLFDPSQGIFNRFLEIVGVEGPAWLSSPEWALSAVVIVGIWKRIGFNLVIYLAALQAIPHTYYEVASLDGAGPITKFLRITVPLVAPSTFFVTVTSIIDSFQAFDLVYVMTSGGPLGSTDVIGYMLYRYGFRYYQLGYASAIAYAMFFLLFAATLIQYRFQHKESAN